MSESQANIHNAVKDQFSKTANAYVASQIHAKGNDLKLMVELAGDVTQKNVLDVATGGGHTALAFARAGATVTASDLTSKMLESAEAFIKSEGFPNVRFVETAAEALAFEDASFDIVTCRIAPHHFANVPQFLAEVTRVLKPGGSFLLIDNISAENNALSETMNKIEKLRDPSHVKAYSLREWTNWLADNYLETFSLMRFERHKEYRSWMKNAQTPKDVTEELEYFILALPAEQKAYLNVVEKDGKLESLTHEVVLIHARRS